ncbi:MAG: response regulator, partial [Verrucomicrobiota bacterium]
LPHSFLLFGSRGFKVTLVVGEAEIRRTPVLIVEDTSMMRVLLARHLKAEGFTTILEAHDGQQALDQLAAHPEVGLILLDIEMPVLNGYETLAKLKADPKLAGIPVVMVTAVEDIEKVIKCLEMGAEDFMPKIFKPALLNARIYNTLERHWLRRKVG